MCGASESDSAGPIDGSASGQTLPPERHRFAFRSDVGEVLDFDEEIDSKVTSYPEGILTTFLVMAIHQRASEARFETSIDEYGRRIVICTLLVDRQHVPTPTMTEGFRTWLRCQVERDDGLLLECEPIYEPEMWWVIEEIERLAGFGHGGRRPSGRFYIRVDYLGFEVLVSITSSREGIRHVLNISDCDLSRIVKIDEANPSI